MELKLTIIAGPHKGKEFSFDRHDTFLVGRTKDAHFQISVDDLSLPRRHFLLEINPPRCRLINLSSRNQTQLNGLRVDSAEVSNGDEIGASHTVFKVCVVGSESKETQKRKARAASRSIDPTLEYEPITEIRGYRVEGEIGRSATGIVYRGTRKKDGLPVAIKTIRPVSGVTPKQIDRFVSQAKFPAELRHENLVRLKEAGSMDGFVYVSMELVDGQNLEQRLQERGVEDVDTSLRIICQALKGLAHAHAKGFVHRNIKPSNVLIASEGEKRVAKLADFGLARAIDSSHLLGFTMQGELGETPAFMAPELVTHFRDIKSAADQYSVAVILYRMLTGKFTHELPRDNSAQLAHIVTVDPVPILEHRPEVTSRLAEVIHKALSREPRDRFPDILAFRKALKWFV